MKISLSTFRTLPPDEQERLIASTRRPPTDADLAELDAEVASFERDAGMTTAALRARLADGTLRETMTHVRWLMVDRLRCDLRAEVEAPPAASCAPARAILDALDARLPGRAIRVDPSSPGAAPGIRVTVCDFVPPDYVPSAPILTIEARHPRAPAAWALLARALHAPPPDAHDPDACARVAAGALARVTPRLAPLDPRAFTGIALRYLLLPRHDPGRGEPDTFAGRETLRVAFGVDPSDASEGVYVSAQVTAEGGAAPTWLEVDAGPFASREDAYAHALHATHAWHARRNLFAACTSTHAYAHGKPGAAAERAMPPEPDRGAELDALLDAQRVRDARLQQFTRDRADPCVGLDDARGRPWSFLPDARFGGVVHFEDDGTTCPVAEAELAPVAGRPWCVAVTRPADPDARPRLLVLDVADRIARGGSR